MKQRSIFGVLFPMLVMVGFVVVGLGNLTIRDHRKYAEMANNTHFTNRTITAGRGTIYDANGAPLAWSATVYKVYMDPSLFRQEMDDIDKIMKKRQERLDAGEDLGKDVIVKPRAQLEAEIVELLSSKLQISQDTVLAAMEKETQYYVLQTQVEKGTADEIMEYFEKLGMDSITTQQDSKRYYPQNEMAAQVIGFTNGDGEGQYGLEAYYDDYLAGVNGRTTSAQDAFGNEMPYRYSTTYEAQDGASLYLTLDTTLQYILEKNLEKMSLAKQVSKRSCGIIMNAKTGAIYAMATYPSFDLNDPSTIYDTATREALEALPKEEYQEAYIAAREQQWKNKAVSELYVPGSVFKIFTASAAVEEKTIDPETYSYYCDGVYEIAGEEIHCHKTSGHQTLDFQGALTESCNPAFIDIGRSLGIHKFSTYFSAFGLREKTGIDLPGEVKSYAFDEEDMSVFDLATSSYGQGNMVTPIEMITGIAAAINGGYLVEPHVVSRIVSSDGNVLKTYSTNTRRQVISEETSAIMRDRLQGVVDQNGGSNAHIDGYKIGGKSGTSQKYVNGKVSSDYYIASYTCFAPADDPDVVLLIMADEPNKEIDYYGSKVAAPYARLIMEEALPYLGYYPEYTEEQYKNLDVNVPLLLDVELETAKSTIESLGLEYEIKGEGEYIVGQCPMTGTSVSAGGTVILYTEENYVAETVEVPDLTGYSASDANAALVNRNLNYVSIGASSNRSDARVAEQSVAPGSMVEVGTVIRLTYQVNDQSG